MSAVAILGPDAARSTDSLPGVDSGIGPGGGGPSAIVSLPLVPRIDFGGPSELPPSTRRDDGRPHLIVLYDRDCGLCTASARRLRRWDRHGRLVMLPLQDATGQGGTELAATVRGLPLTAALHVVDEATGRVEAGGDAALAIGRALPGGWIVGIIGRIPPGRWAIGVGYRVVARHRRRIGRWLRLEGPSCVVPR